MATQVTSTVEKYLDKASKWIQTKGYKEIKGKVPEHEDPATLHRQRDDKGFTPDFTALRRGGKHYFSIARKRKDNMQELISQWKLFATLASMKKGRFVILAPRGTLTFARSVIEQYNIEADIKKLA